MLIHILLVIILQFIFSVKCAGYFNFKNEISNDVLNYLVPISKSVENKLCRNHSLLYLKELNKFTYWAAKMFDASSKIPSGILVGSTSDLGNYDECLQIKVPFENEAGFVGKYCLAKFTFNATNVTFVNTINYNDSVWSVIDTLSKDPSKQKRNVIRWSYCIPSTCNANDVRTNFEEIADFFHNSYQIRISLELDESNCQVHEEFSFNYGDISFMIFVFVWIFMVLPIATIYDLFIIKDKKATWRTAHYILISFSMRKSLKKLGTITEEREELACLHGLKVYSMALIIMGHRIMFSLNSPIINITFFEDFYKRPDAAVLLNGPIIVNTFFVISGFLTSYLIIKEFSKSISFNNIIQIYLHRLIRLTPSYVIIVTFYCTIFSKISSGPFWNELIKSESDRCTKIWWANLLYINNYFKTNYLCMFQSWYIACDMQYFLICVPLVWLLRRKPKFGLVLLGTLTILSMILPIMTVYRKNLSAILLLHINTLQNLLKSETFQNLYIPSYTRATPYFMGIIGGYILYKLKESNYKLNKFVIYFGWIIAVFLMESTTYISFYFYSSKENSNKLFSSLYAGLHHFTWSASIIWFIIATSAKCGELIQPILTWPPLIILSRLTYGAFLCHGAIQLYSIGVARAPWHASVFSLLYTTFGDISMSYFVALVLAVAVEYPVAALEDTFMRKKK